MPSYKHILFDLDHTLWDFEKNATEALYELYASYSLADHNFSAEKFCEIFHQVNYHLWHLHQTGDYDQARLRADRFKMIFAQLGMADHDMPLDIADAYLQLCPSKPYVFPHTYDMLEYLQSRYHLHIVTNGFSDVQWVKLNSARLTPYFTQVVTSDDAGYRKPHPGIFNHILERIAASPAECVMIGDNLDTDIAGARAVGIDCIFFNPKETPHEAIINHEIHCLSQLQGIL